MMTAIRISLLLLWLASLAFAGISAWCLSSLLRRGRAARAESDLPPVTVLKPMRGSDENTPGNIKSFIRQDYPRYQVVFGIADPSDPARPVVERLMAENPGRDVELVVSGSKLGANRKVSNLHNMHARSRHDIIVIADGDMRVGPDYLREVVSGFDGPEVGLVTCPYRGVYPKSVGAAFEALTINTDFLPSVAVAERLEGLSFALGATMAVRREALDGIGGFPALADYLADDYQLGNKVKKAGYKLTLSPYVVDSVQGRESFSEYFHHQLRWGRTYRACRPGGYFLSVLTKGTAFSVLFLAADGFGPAGWALVGANLALRYAQALHVERCVKATGTLRYFWLLPAKDLVGFLLWALSFTGRKVTWKDKGFTIDGEGRMRELG